MSLNSTTYHVALATHSTHLCLSIFILKIGLALARWLHWLDYCPVNQKIAGSIPNQGTYLGLIPIQGTYGRNRCLSVCLSVYLSLTHSPSLSKSNEQNLRGDFFNGMIIIVPLSERLCKC